MKTVIANLIFIAAMPFLFQGIIYRVKAFWAGRKGMPLLQPLYDFIKYLRKGVVVSTTVTPVFFAAPAVSFVMVIAAACLAPLFGGASMAGFNGDFILFAYLLGMSKFISVVSAMDTGSSFEGMGAAREVSFTALVEPAFFMIMGTAAAFSGAGSFESVRGLPAAGTAQAWLMAWVAAAALMIMMLTEGSRVPVDDPNTHLELTMIHEVMVLDNSGPDMALINYTAGLKMTVISALAVNFILPAEVTGWAAAGLFAAGVAGAAVLTGCVESLTARLRMTHVPQFVLFMLSLAVVVFTAAYILTSGGLK